MSTTLNKSDNQTGQYLILHTNVKYNDVATTVSPV